MASFLQPPLDYVCMWRFPETQLERAREVRRGPPRDGAEVLGVNGPVQVLVDEGSHPRNLPAGQSPRAGSPRARIAFDLRSQNCRSGGQPPLRRLVVVLELAPHHFKKLCQTARQIAELDTGWRRIRCSAWRPFHVNPSTSNPSQGEHAASDPIWLVK